MKYVSNGNVFSFHVFFTGHGTSIENNWLKYADTGISIDFFMPTEIALCFYSAHFLWLKTLW